MFKEAYFGKEKENRKAYRGSKSFDKTCRCHGTCDWCKENRLYSTNKNIARAKAMFKEFLRNEI